MDGSWWGLVGVFPCFVRSFKGWANFFPLKLDSNFARGSAHGCIQMKKGVTLIP